MCVCHVCDTLKYLQSVSYVLYFVQSLIKLFIYAIFTPNIKYCVQKSIKTYFYTLKNHFNFEIVHGTTRFVFSAFISAHVQVSKGKIIYFKA